MASKLFAKPAGAFKFFMEIAVAAAVGPLTQLLADIFFWETGTAFVLAGLSGWAGPHILNWIVSAVLSLAGK
ncbi:MAG: hypothetical protein LBK41_01110 [Clostridiales bacterium]|nr:hypothetical protein [Clostridiales bacterium]